MYLLCDMIVQDHKEGKNTENMSGFASAAYDKSLKKHHNLIVKGIFAVSINTLLIKKVYKST